MTRNLGGQTGGFFGGLFKFCRDYHPFLWKFYGNALDLDAVRVANDAGAFTIGREVRGDQFDPSESVADAVARALRYADLVLSRAFFFGALISAWEFYNEPVVNISHADGTPNIPASIRAAQALNAAQIAFSNRLHTFGFKVVAYNLARGNPFYEVFPYLAGGCEASDYLGLHAYGAPFYETDADNQSLRYRRLYASLPASARRPIIFTEHGTDWNGGGFRLPANGMSVDRFFTSMDWWAHETAKDDYVFGSCAFVVGADSARWATFEIAEEDSLPLFGALVSKDIHVIPNPPLSHSVSASASPSTSRSASISSSTSASAAPPEDDMQIYGPYLFPRTLSDIGWMGMPLDPIVNQPYYRIQPSAGVRLGVSAYAQLCIVSAQGIPLAGVKVVNDFGDGTGELLQSDAAGLVQFNFGPSSAFNPPMRPPLAIYVVDANAWVEPDRPHILHYTHKLSDILFAGDTNGTHTQGSATYVQQVVMPDASSRDDAIRLRAYPAKALSIAVYCERCALQAEARRRSLGAVLSDEFYVTYGGATYVAQGFARAILATALGHYAPSDFFTIDW